jgi:hypothetical protein
MLLYHEFSVRVLASVSVAERETLAADEEEAPGGARSEPVPLPHS